MADASNLQTGFLGGEWSPYAQGNVEDKEYRKALNLCLNGYPIEAGAWTRRQGTRFCATTRFGLPGWLLPFAFTQAAPYTMEFTNQMLRLFNGPLLVSTPDAQTVVSVSAANPAVITTTTAHGWTSGQQVQFLFSKSQAYPTAGLLMNRQFLITVLSSTTFSISDPITGLGVDGLLITLPKNVSQVVRVTEIASPYLQTELPSINRVQAEKTVVTLHPSYTPWALTQLTQPAANAFATFAFAPAIFQDGPYQDPATTGTLTPSAKTGTIVLSGAPANTFVATDVGRFIRLFSEPLNYNSGTAYTTGNTVKNTDGLYYTAIANSTGKQPDLNPTLWGVNVSGAIWTWGVITVVTNGTTVSFTINGADLLYVAPIVTWRLGLYSDTTGYPTCGVYHEGRLWLAGAKGNRIDSTAIPATALPAGTFNFAPTGSDGTVSDSNAMSYIFNAEDVNTIFWMQPFNSGIVCGTQGGEWMVAASQLNDPLTPTSIQAHRRSKYKSQNTQAVAGTFSLLFVKAAGLRLMEYVADVFSGKLLGRNLSEKASHLTTSGLAQIGYQQDKNPVLWGRTNKGQLVGTTYKRESSFTSEPPTFNAWHQHVLGSGRVAESISVGPSVNGNYDSLSMVTNDPNTNIRHVEIMTDMFDESNTITDAWFLDDAVTPTAAVENLANTTMQFYGMSYLAGFTVSVWAGGLDLGDYVVAADGSVTVPVNSTSTNFGLSLFTDAYLSSLIATGASFGGLGVPLNRTVNVKYPIPAGATIQSYLPLTFTGSAFVDAYKFNRVYVASIGTTSAAGLASFDRFTGVSLVEKTAPQIYGVGSTLGIYTPVIPDTQGNLYFGSTLSNDTRIMKVDKNLNLINAFGVIGSGFTNDNAHIQPMASGVIVKNYGTQYLVSSAAVFGTITVLNADAMQWAGHTYQPVDNKPGSICAGENVDLAGVGSYAAVYTTTCPGAGASTSLKLYKTTIFGATAFTYINPPSTTGTPAARVNAGINTVQIGTVTPAQVDATWTTFAAFADPVYDNIDGNIILFANTTDVVTNQSYVLKINAATAAVMWATPVVGALNSDARVVCLSSVKFGLISLFQNVPPKNVVTLNTISGSVVNTSLQAGLIFGSSVSNDTDGSLVAFGQWAIGTTITGLNGTTPLANTTFRIMGLPGITGQVTEAQNGLIPVVIGFTYNSQGQRLRDIAPDASGARNGPALGKTRRNHRISALLAQCQGISFGTDFIKLHPAVLKSKGGSGTITIPKNVMYTGVWSSPEEDNYSYDGMVTWKISRPYPATVAAIGAFLHAEDR